MGDFCAHFFRNSHCSFPQSVISCTSAAPLPSYCLPRLSFPPKHIGVDMSAKWEKSAKKWRKILSAIHIATLTYQNSNKTTFYCASSVQALHLTAFSQNVVWRNALLTRARTRAFPGILHKKPSQPSHHRSQTCKFRFLNTPVIFPSISPLKFAEKGNFQRTLLKNVRKPLVYH